MLKNFDALSAFTENERELTLYVDSLRHPCALAEITILQRLPDACEQAGTTDEEVERQVDTERPSETLGELYQRLNLDQHDLADVVRKIARSMLNYWGKMSVVRDINYKCWTAAIRAVWACKKYIDDSEQLLKELHRVHMRWQGSMVGMQEGELLNSLLPYHQNAKLSDVISLLLSEDVGFTEEEVCEIWADMVCARKRAGASTCFVVNLWNGVSTPSGREMTQVCEQTIHEMLIERLERVCTGTWEEGRLSFLDSSSVMSYQNLLKQTDEEWRMTVFAEIFEEELIRALSRGYLATASALLGHLGELLKLCNSKYRNRWSALEKLAKPAAQIAERKGQYGIASALHREFGCEVEADRLGHLAKTRQQLCRLHHDDSIT